MSCQCVVASKWVLRLIGISFISVVPPLAVHADILVAPNAIRESATTQKADAQLRSPSTVTSQWGTTLRLFYTTTTSCDNAMLVFQLPDLGGKSIASANLTVTGYKSNANATYTQAVDLYGVRYKQNTASTSDTEVLTTDFPVQAAYVASNNGTGIMNDLIPRNTTTAADGAYSTDAPAQIALGAWLQAQYDTGAVAGDYVFLRLNVDTDPLGSANYNYRGWTIYSADSTTNQPSLTITTSAPTNVKGYMVSSGDHWSDGTVRPAATTVLKVGRANTVLSAAVMSFDLPDLNGANIVSAKFRFRVDSTTNQTSSHFTNMNLEAIRSSSVSGTRISSDYLGLGLRSGEVLVQSQISLWNDSPLPMSYETSAAAGTILGNWLAAQYASVGAGGLAFLRLAPGSDPNFNGTYFNIAPDSLELIIITDGNTPPIRGNGTTVSAKVGSAQFSWTFDRAVEWGHFIDGQPWVLMPAGGVLNLTAASPSRLNGQAVYTRDPSNGTYIPYTADINITVKNPPFDHYFNGTGWTDNPSGVFGWDSRGGHMQTTCSPTYNATIGWNGSSPLPLAVGDSITTPKSMTSSNMTSRSTPLDALAVLTVVGSIPSDDAFRPGVIRAGVDRTNPEILRYSNLINLDPCLIASPVNVTTDLANQTMASIPPQYSFYQIKSLLNGPWFMNTGYSMSEGANAMQNHYTLPGGAMYGGTLGGYMGQVGIGCLAGWLSPEERKSCRIRYIQRAIDVYSAVKAGVCLEEGAGIMPGYSTLLTNAGVMMNHAGMKSVNNGVNGVKPYWIFADYATMYHTDNVPASDLFSGEGQSERLVSLYSATTTNYPDLNKAGVQPVAASAADTMTMRTDFRWSFTGRPICNVLNMKVKITGGAGAGPTIYTITEAVTNGVTDPEKFRNTSGTLFTHGGNAMGFVLGGKVRVKPAWANGLPDASSVLTMSIFARDAANPLADGAKWFFNVAGRKLPANPATLDKVNSVSTSPQAEYASVQTGGTMDNLIVLYALGQEGLYKGGLDKYLIQVGQIPGYGEELFKGSYLQALGWNGTSYNMRGALWKQEVLNPLGKTFNYTATTGASALPVVNTSAKLWNEP